MLILQTRLRTSSKLLLMALIWNYTMPQERRMTKSLFGGLRKECCFQLIMFIRLFQICMPSEGLKQGKKNQNSKTGLGQAWGTSFCRTMHVPRKNSDLRTPKSFYQATHSNRLPKIVVFVLSLVFFPQTKFSRF